MKTRYVIILGIILLSFLLLACVDDLDVDRGGFPLTATASAEKEVEMRQVEKSAQETVEAIRKGAEEE